jgi:hypothetical protein
MESFDVPNIDDFKVVIDCFDYESLQADCGFIYFLNYELYRFATLLLALQMANIDCFSHNHPFNTSDILEQINFS